MASIVNTSTKFFTDTMTGAPALNNGAGSLVALLDAVLVTGFGIKSATSLVIAGGIATLAFAAPASAAAPECVIAISGITGTYAALNGEQKVKTVSGTTVTFATNLADGTAAGTITFKIAPLGWEKVYAGTNKAVYRPLDPACTRPYLRVLDTAAAPASAYHARVLMYESMTDVDTGTNQAPPTASAAGPGGYWWKTNYNTAAVQAWTIVGDGRAFYFCPCTHFSGSGTTQAAVHFFGDIKAYKSGDAYCAALVTALGEVSSSPPYGPNYSSNSAGVYAGHVMRAPNGLGVARVLGWFGLGGSSGGYSGGDNNALGSYPNPANNGLLMSDIVVGQTPLSTFGPRGTFPGAIYVPQSGANNAQFPRGTLLDGTGAYAGSKLFAVSCGGTLSTPGQDYPMFFDVTKDWRA